MIVSAIIYNAISLFADVRSLTFALVLYFKISSIYSLKIIDPSASSFTISASSSLKIWKIITYHYICS